MDYLTIKSVVAIDLEKTNDRSLAKVRGTVMKQPRLIFDNRIDEFVSND